MLLGNMVSMTNISCPNLFSIRPTGFLSKNDIGDLRTVFNIFAWNIRQARIFPVQTTSARMNVVIAEICKLYTNIEDWGVKLLYLFILLYVKTIQLQLFFAKPSTYTEEKRKAIFISKHISNLQYLHFAMVYYQL